MLKDVKITGFVTPYALNCRKRHQHNRQRNKIVKFVVQLEVLVKENWHPIIRYDTAHGFAHCDIISYSGKVKKVRMPTLDYKEALNYADDDLNENWQAYYNRYLKEIPNE